MTQKRILHFTLGPVQGFIADARRTRDLWAGSFLLSWLAGHAMAKLREAATHDKEKVIVFPMVENDDLFQSILAPDRSHSPYIGSLPNRFKADVSNIPKDKSPGKICEEAIIDAWGKLATKVWDQFIAPVEEKGNETKKIWDRQTNSFWQTNWVIGSESDDDGNWLNQRKHWHNQLAPDEAGDLCRLMGNYQEISGYHRIGSQEQQKNFWASLAKQKRIGPLNLRKDERLCAIALIKRLFPLIAKDIVGWQPGGDVVDIIHWPSVSYIAAVPWLKEVERLGNYAQSSYFQTAIKNVIPGVMGETDTKLFGLPGNGIFKLDGHLLHQDGIDAWKTDDFKGQNTKEKESSRRKLLTSLATLQMTTGHAASEFYAVLIMDGDKIGTKINDEENVVKKGLANFTGAVKHYFAPPRMPSEKEKNIASGALIYAGGDDVLALVPVDTALLAAQNLRKAYDVAFSQAVAGSGQKVLKDSEYTMSGAIIFAQYKIPLRAVLRQAHHYLDEIAKKQNGRDSLAVAIMKPGGIAYDWVSCWHDEKLNPVKTLQLVANQSAGDNPDYSTSFFQNIRARYAPLFENDNTKTPPNDPSRSEGTGPLGIDFMGSVLAAEFKKQPGRQELEFTKAEAAVAPLLTIGRPLRRKGKKRSPAYDYNFDAVLVARFIATQLMVSIQEKDVNRDN
ncbi:type III-B CRISPR-associated protein Cas10/Cmr2 [uncultured Cohaesibacter sp.]|uniref:Cas10/Cmr2 second palm domain-containing protein n=1 Tax=uncultured Cohaesibacter sp. TaxID=1002546 RepID=UPI002AA7AE9F|nr:type III-B CRISPR-associated protein Cas10/Cmr2 [uncultured Cohaesibacter sp.]